MGVDLRCVLRHGSLLRSGQEKRWISGDDAEERLDGATGEDRAAQEVRMRPHELVDRPDVAGIEADVNPGVPGGSRHTRLPSG